jgi:hypothetical protein
VVLEKGHYDEDAWETNARSDRTQFWRDDGFIVASVALSGDEEAYAITRVRPGQCPGVAEAAASSHPVTVWRAVDLDAIEGPPFGALRNYGVNVAKSLADCPPYEATHGILLPTFEAVPGQATYLGAVRVDVLHTTSWQKVPRSVRITLLPASDDIEQAARFLAKTFPRVRTKLTPGHFRMQPRRH